MVRLIYPPRCELDHNWQAQHPRRDRGASVPCGHEGGKRTEPEKAASAIQNMRGAIHSLGSRDRTPAWDSNFNQTKDARIC